MTYRVGSAYCYAEFENELDYREYLLRNYPSLLAKEYPEKTPAPLLCRHGLHTWVVRIDRDGSGAVDNARVCKRCQAVETQWGRGGWIRLRPNV